MSAGFLKDNKRVSHCTSLVSCVRIWIAEPTKEIGKSWLLSLSFLKLNLGLICSTIERTVIVFLLFSIYIKNERILKSVQTKLNINPECKFATV